MRRSTSAAPIISGAPILSAALALGTLAMLVGASSTAAFAADGTPSATAVVVETPPEFVPHRAVYDLDLDTAQARASVTHVSGTMRFQWEQSCDAWLIEQTYDMAVTPLDGSTTRVISTYETHERHDGTEFAFDYRTLVGGVEQEAFLGAVLRTPDGSGVVRYREPDKNDVVLAADTLFPSRHGLALLAAAQAGDAFFPATLFDGTSEQGVSLVSAVIGPRRSTDADTTDTADSGSLVRGDHWMIRLAFFSNAEGEAAPDHEIAGLLYETGVIDNLVMDFGPFAIRARLRSVEALPAPDC